MLAEVPNRDVCEGGEVKGVPPNAPGIDVVRLLDEPKRPPPDCCVLLAELDPKIVFDALLLLGAELKSPEVFAPPDEAGAANEKVGASDIVRRPDFRFHQMPILATCSPNLSLDKSYFGPVIRLAAK